MPDRPDLPILFSPAALTDLEDIINFRIAQQGEDAGDALLDTLVGRATALCQFPRRGARPKELEGQGEDEIRQIVSGLYRIIYDVQADHVLIVLIADGRRDMQRLLRERLRAMPNSNP